MQDSKYTLHTMNTACDCWVFFGISLFYLNLTFLTLLHCQSKSIGNDENLICKTYLVTLIAYDNLDWIIITAKKLWSLVTNNNNPSRVNKCVIGSYDSVKYGTFRIIKFQILSPVLCWGSKQSVVGPLLKKVF